MSSRMDRYRDKGDNGLSEVKKEEVQEDEKQAVRDAAEACPTGAIEVEE